MLFVSLSDVSSPVLCDEGGKYQNFENIGHGVALAEGRAEGVYISSKFGILAQSVPKPFQEHPLLPFHHSIMANPEHLAILKQGVEVWNQWREENYNIHPDLSEVNLSGVNLNRYMLRDVSLFNADLSSADLYGTNLNNAKLIDVNVSNAIAGFTSFGGVDLSLVKGLEAIVHGAPSTIGIDTLYYSQGNIPEVFLRGCGVPDQMIEYARSLTSTPIQYYSCFISYSHKDEELAQRIHNDLQAAGLRLMI
ncbi:toll/interleukin-1 receptor domain-containing protein [Chlorobaculum sp. MV4-Y]|uniref:toll/interleukin-1 receptor domain-containing protein n=1 Tax=Chlorobaculum sp. MV4-Y TaxID=2976335 RepID=UPI0021AEE3CB|nr:toll/interleukin-1 receptor domain-containing protein [Chlorobaculum sp. MV4-Y]UWX56769.1 toll/interleukin-1 receptor domain-containing protein [Chlorobaculum sp. MV4-Y]